MSRAVQVAWLRARAVEVVPPAIIALVVLPYLINFHAEQSLPWNPATIDLAVYRQAVTGMANQQNIYLMASQGWQLYFLYPPFAAIVLAPLAFGSYTFWQVVWTLAGVGAQQLVLARSGVPRGWPLALAGCVAVLAVEPIRTTLGYGQINTLLMALVVADFLPARGRPRWLPPGILTGIAAGIKLTPILFILLAFAIGRWRHGLRAAATWLLTVVLGFLVLNPESKQYWTSLVGHELVLSGPVYVGNQAFSGLLARVFEVDPTLRLGRASMVVIALVAVTVGALWWRARPASLPRQVFALSLVGVGSCLASPVAWTHHFVWVLPLAVAVLTSRGVIPRWVRLLAGAWALWTCVGLPLVLLPYGGGPELRYTPWQDLIGSFGPGLGVVLLSALAVREALVEPAAVTPPAES